MKKMIEICVIDDEQIVCERLQPILEKRGFNVETFIDSKKLLPGFQKKSLIY